MTDPNSPYIKGRTCSQCGRHLDAFDSFSIKYKKGTETILCNDCDPDMKEATT
jgi:RNase P subunit RPR2